MKYPILAVVFVWFVIASILGVACGWNGFAPILRALQYAAAALNGPFCSIFFAVAAAVILGYGAWDLLTRGGTR